MTVAVPTSLVGELILARLLTAAKRPPGPAQLRKDLERFFRHPPSSERWQEHVDELVAAGLLVAKPYRLTEAGRAQALAFLELEALPRRCDWKSLCSRHLIPKAIGLPPDAAALREQVAQPEGLTAYLLKTRHELPLGAGATLTAVLEALVCKELGFPEQTTLKGVKVAMMNRLLGDGEPLKAAELQRRLPARLLGASQPKVDAIREVILRDWLQEDTLEETAPGVARPSLDGPAEVSTFDLPAFAATVRAIALHCPTGHFGDNKVFISHVWRQFREEPGVPALDLPEFKARLVEANQAGLLRLSRADLVQVMDPAAVAESETPYLNTTFHFILLAGDRP